MRAICGKTLGCIKEYLIIIRINIIFIGVYKGNRAVMH